MPMNFVGGLLVGAAILAVLVAVRFAIAFVRAESNPFRVAFRRTGRWAWGIAGAAAGVVGMGFVELGQFVDALVGLVAMNPMGVSNLAIGGLGAGALAGVFDLSAGQYVGVALALIGIVLLVVEVSD